MGPKETVPSVLLTGAGGGIGRATMDLFLARGWRVLAVDLHAAEGGFPDGATFLQTDIALPENIEQLAGQANQLLGGRLNALVNNAAIQIPSSLTSLQAADWDATMVVNLRAPFLLAKQLYPLLRPARGAIVNVSSVHAHATAPEMGIYATSKGALQELTRYMAIEFAPDHVRANAILPGATRTEMLMKSMAREQLEGGDAATRLAALSAKIPLQQISLPEEIAQAIYFLCDESMSSSVTGSSVVVDGGALALGQ